MEDRGRGHWCEGKVTWKTVEMNLRQSTRRHCWDTNDHTNALTSPVVSVFEHVSGCSEAAPTPRSAAVPATGRLSPGFQRHLLVETAKETSVGVSCVYQFPREKGREPVMGLAAATHTVQHLPLQTQTQ